MLAEMIDVPSKDSGTFKGYCAKPTSGTGPAIVMIPGMFGITAWIKQTADNFARHGFIVIVPDMFSRVEAGFVADSMLDQESKKYFSYSEVMNHDTAIDDISSTIAAAKAMPGCNEKAGVVGFSLGGTVTYLAAARLTLDIAVAYYGTQIRDYFNEGKSVTCPILLHIGEYDDTHTVEDRKKTHAALISKKTFRSICIRLATHSPIPIGHLITNPETRRQLMSVPLNCSIN